MSTVTCAGSEDAILRQFLGPTFWPSQWSIRHNPASSVGIGGNHSTSDTNSIPDERTPLSHLDSPPGNDSYGSIPSPPPPQSPCQPSPPSSLSCLPSIGIQIPGMNPGPQTFPWCLYMTSPALASVARDHLVHDVALLRLFLTQVLERERTDPGSAFVPSIRRFATRLNQGLSLKVLSTETYASLWETTQLV